MRVRSFGLWAAALLLSATSVFAQEATILGTVTDASKGVLPGVTVTATSLANGRTFTDVSNERGDYRLVGVPAGRYKVQAELSGFATVIVPDVELLVGQNRTVPFAMQVASLSETLTVTGEAPLVDVSSSQVTGNVDRRQMEELPLQGRNWMELAMQVKGITTNAVDTNPVRDRQFQLNLDGQEITQQVAGGGFGQPRFSREAIAEFQVITNLFDITQGRSLGIQVQAISRSGTNNIDGSVYGYFRDDKMNSKDFVANRVLPYSNQQIGAAIGGPIVRDKLHYFLSYERENEPSTIVTTPNALPAFTWSFPTKLVQNSFLGRADWQMAPKDHLTTRMSYWDWDNPFTQVAGTEHPSQAAKRSRRAFNIANTWAKVLTDTTVQEVKIGYSHFDWKNLLAEDKLANSPNYVFPTITIGQRRNYPQEFYQNTFSFRYDLTSSRGNHDIKFGTEFLRWKDTGQWQLLSRGEYIFSSTPSDLARRFPQDAWNDPSKWDLTGLDSTVTRFDQNFGDWTINIPRPTYAIWLGDTWKINNSFSLNGGIRWDADFGALDPPDVDVAVTFNPKAGYVANTDLQAGEKLYPGGLRDIMNIAPRGGFTWNVGGNGKLVIRGGSGLYFSIPDSNTTFSQQSFNTSRILTNSFANDGQPGFLANPTRGVTPAQILAGAVPLPAQGPRVIAHDYKMPSTWQSSIGFQTQFGERWGFEADLTHWKGFNFARQRDPNLQFNPATGYNIAPTAATRPDAKFGQIQWLESTGKADFAAISSGLTKRYANNWQASVSYTLTLFQNDNTTNFQYQANNPFDPDADWARSQEFQRHTLRVNAIYRLPFDINLSGAYLFGSGNYYQINYGANPFGPVSSANRYVTAPVTVPADVADRFDGPTSFAVGDLIPRNALQGLALHRVDLRLAKDIPLPGGMRLGLIAEAFNILNHKNYGAYQTTINNPGFGSPRQNLLNAYQPRVGQVAFKLSF